jgi:hypothetical protein
VVVLDKAKSEAEEGLKLKVSEKEEQIASVQRLIEELKRRAEQGSQLLQGEVQELELESLLRHNVLHRVNGPQGQLCGTILWESKRTKNWSGTWLPKNCPIKWRP